jgi:hypothetical protein
VESKITGKIPAGNVQSCNANTVSVDVSTLLSGSSVIFTFRTVCAHATLYDVSGSGSNKLT